MTVEIHPCEPKLGDLKKLRKELFKAKSTDDNVRKLEALDVQIQRHEKAAADVKAAEVKKADGDKRVADMAEKAESAKHSPAGRHSR